MKKAELVALLDKGPVMVGEYRGGMADKVEITDEKTGRVSPMEFVKVKLEIGVYPEIQTLEISIGGSRGAGIEEFKAARALLPTIKRGAQVAVCLTSFAWGKRGLAARGSAVHILE